MAVCRIRFPNSRGFSTGRSNPPASVVGVDIGSACIKVVQLRRKSGKAVLETYGSLAIGPYGGVEIGRATHLPPDKIAEALRDLLRESACYCDPRRVLNTIRLKSRRDYGYARP